MAHAKTRCSGKSAKTSRRSSPPTIRIHGACRLTRWRPPSTTGGTRKRTRANPSGVGAGHRGARLLESLVASFWKLATREPPPPRAARGARERRRQEAPARAPARGPGERPGMSALALAEQGDSVADGDHDPVDSRVGAHVVVEVADAGEAFVDDVRI